MQLGSYSQYLIYDIIFLLVILYLLIFIWDSFLCVLLAISCWYSLCLVFYNWTLKIRGYLLICLFLKCATTYGCSYKTLQRLYIKLYKKGEEQFEVDQVFQLPGQISTIQNKIIVVVLMYFSYIKYFLSLLSLGCFEELMFYVNIKIHVVLWYFWYCYLCLWILLMKVKILFKIFCTCNSRYMYLYISHVNFTFHPLSLNSALILRYNLWVFCLT